MLEKKSILTLVILSASCLFGLFLLTAYGDDLGSDLDGWLVLVGFLVFMGSGGGVIALLVRQFPKRMTVEESSRWELTRVKGKWAYVLNYLVAICPLALIALSLSMFFPGNSEIPMDELLRNFGVVAIVVFGCVIFVALSLWKFNEKNQDSMLSQDKEISEDPPTDLDRRN